jgi:integrase
MTKTPTKKPLIGADRLLGESPDAISSRIALVRPSKLTVEQHATMFSTLCAAIVTASPTNFEEARQWMTILSGFIHDVAPTEGGDLWSFLTDSRISLWVSQGALNGRSLHTLNARRGVLTRVLAAHRGVAVGRAAQSRRAPSCAPLGEVDALRLLRACEQDSLSALRGYLAHIAAGVPRASRKVSFTTTGRQGTLRDDSTIWTIAPVETDLTKLSGERLIDEDWVALRGVARDLGIRLSESIVTQTFRSLAVADDRQPLGARFLAYRLNEISITATNEHLDPLTDQSRQLLLPLLRDGRPGTECADSATQTCSPRLPKGGKGGDSASMSRKSSRAATKRLADERMAEAAQRCLKAGPIDAYVATFVPDDGDALWDVIASTVRDSVTRCRFTNIETARKHAVALAAYLRWRATSGFVTDATASLTFEAIDSFFAHGMPDLSERSKRDYRSRLRGIATRVNASVAAPPSLALGYNQVNPGYTRDEEITLRRVALDQGDTEARRRLCAIVGFCCGAGLSSSELRALRRRDVTIKANGMILIALGGERPRLTVVRRNYEVHVLAALEGLQSAETILPQLKSSSPITVILKGADLFDDAPRIDTRRLRTTWITWLMNQRIPLRLAFEASGLQSARTFFDILPYLAGESPTQELRDGGAG